MNKRIFRLLKRCFVCWVMLSAAIWAVDGLSVAGLAQTATATLPPLAPPAPGAVLERPLQTGQSQAIVFSLAAHEFLQLGLEHQGVTLTFTLTDAAGQVVASASSGIELLGRLEIAYVAPQTSRYQLTARATGKVSQQGQFQLRVLAQRPATQADVQHATAQRLNNEGDQFFYQQTAAARQQARAKYEEAVSYWRTTAYGAGEVRTLYALGLTQEYLGESVTGLARLEEALTRAKTLPERLPEAETLLRLGQVYQRTGKIRQCMESCQQALALSRQHGYRAEEMLAQYWLGAIYGRLRDNAATMTALQEALRLARELHDPLAEASILNSLASQQLVLGDTYQALQTYQQALALLRDQGTIQDIATTVFNLAGSHFTLNQFQPALTYSRQALELYRQTDSLMGEATALMSIGTLYARLGEPAAARETLDQALALSLRIGNRRNEALVRMNLGSIMQGSSQFEAALAQYEKALELYRTDGDRRSVSTVFIRLGNFWLERKDLTKAQDFFEQARTLSHELNLPQVEARCLLGLGQIQFQRSQIAAALGLLEQGRTLAQQAKLPGIEAELWRELARTALAQGAFATAAAHIGQALNLIEQSRSGILNVDLRNSYRGTVQSYYDLQLEALLRQYAQTPEARWLAQAFESAEHARAQSLLELLHEAQSDLQQGVESRLLEQERTLRRDLTQLSEKLALRGTRDTSPATLELKAQVDKLSREHQTIEGRIRAASPAYATLALTPALKLAELQREITADTLVLEYVLGTERSHLFALTTTSLQVFALPGRAELEAAARRLHELLEQPQPATAFRNLAEKQRWQATHEQQIQTVLQQLGTWLLQPAAAQFGSRRVLIVPDGALHYVPFAALPAPPAPPTSVIAPLKAASSAKKAERKPTAAAPLIVNHEILTLPAASLLVRLRHQLNGRPPAPKALAVLADPVFEATDQRLQPSATLAQNTQIQAALEPELRRSLRNSNETAPTLTIPRLPATRREAEGIWRLVPNADRKVALDFQANQTTARSAELGQYRFLHFATHGVLNTEHPELSGLLLSLVNEQGQPQAGFLSALDVYKLKFPAELVVLSGCRTALGKEMRGEGMVGLTRGFMYAGARRVMASLWQVNDTATAELMRRFYQNLLPSQPNTAALSPAAALRAAQLSMLNDARWRSPYYWAAFTLQGEW